MGHRRYKRKSSVDELFDVLFELTGFFWPVGAVVTGVLLFLSYMAYDWVETGITNAEKSPMLLQVAINFGWMGYLLPLMLTILALLFGVKTYNAYRNEHRF
jgi:TRAP-type C4-dicarboxylate transport system permease small subunit